MVAWPQQRQITRISKQIRDITIWNSKGHAGASWSDAINKVEDEENLCRQALIERRDTCNGEDLLTECIEMCKELRVSSASEGNPKIGKIRSAGWRENDKDIRKLLEGKKRW